MQDPQKRACEGYNIHRTKLPMGYTLSSKNCCLDLSLSSSPFMLTSCCKFSLNREKDPDWDADIRDDVLEECTKYGHVFHIHVDKNSNQVCIESSVQFSFVYPD